MNVPNVCEGRIKTDVKQCYQAIKDPFFAYHSIFHSFDTNIQCNLVEIGILSFNSLYTNELFLLV